MPKLISTFTNIYLFNVCTILHIKYLMVLSFIYSLIFSKNAGMNLFLFYERLFIFHLHHFVRNSCGIKSRWSDGGSYNLKSLQLWTMGFVLYNGKKEKYKRLLNSNFFFSFLCFLTAVFVFVVVFF